MTSTPRLSSISDLVGIVDPAKRLHDYPHQLSGGMQQRVMIAHGASVPSRPAGGRDEPTTALDVTDPGPDQGSVERTANGSSIMSIILITHNFGIINGIADRVAVMFRGTIVE